MFICQLQLFVLMKIWIFVQIEMPIDKAKSTLLRLGLVTETALEDGTILQAVPCSRVAEILRQKWDGLLA